MKAIYSKQFYQNRHDDTAHSADAVLGALWKYYQPKSMVDFGCGVGTWLHQASEMGVTSILGLEGEWLNKEQLVIPAENFQYGDLSMPVKLPHRFDVAISLEVAEHVAESAADNFINNLCQAADVVMFSAAIPGQRGSGHINEQWPSYWVSKFAAKGYKAFDVIRPQVWTDAKVKGWYKQNILLYVKEDKLAALPHLLALANNRTVYDLVHPETFLRQVELSHPKYSSYSAVIKSLPLLTVNAFVRNTKKLLKKL